MSTAPSRFMPDLISKDGKDVASHQKKWATPVVSRVRQARLEASSDTKI